MSASVDSPALPCEDAGPCPQPAADPSAESQTAETRPTDTSPPRPRKEVLLPEIAELALEGHCSRAIGKKLGVPRRTVDRWLGKLRQEWAQNATESGQELLAVAVARLESVYRQAMEAWRRSLVDSQVTVETLGGDGGEKTNGTLRKATQSGQAALLGKAIAAAREISHFHARHMQSLAAERERKRHRARYELAAQLGGIPKTDFRAIKDVLLMDGTLPPRSELDELIDQLSTMSDVEYHELDDMLRNHFRRELPLRPTAETEELRDEVGEMKDEGGGRKDEGGEMRDEGGGMKGCGWGE